MLTNQLALKYAQAVYELAAEKHLLDRAQEQLQMVESALASHGDLSVLFYHPRVPATAKKEVIAQVFKEQLEDFLYKFLLLLVDKRRETVLPGIIKEYVRLANEERNIGEADVTSAMALTEAQLQALAAQLGKVTGKNIVLKTHVDPRIMGGVIVKIGDKLIDGSVKRRLQSLQTALLAQ